MTTLKLNKVAPKHAAIFAFLFAVLAVPGAQAEEFVCATEGGSIEGCVFEKTADGIQVHWEGPVWFVQGDEMGELIERGKDVPLLKIEADLQGIDMKKVEAASRPGKSETKGKLEGGRYDKVPYGVAEGSESEAKRSVNTLGDDLQIHAAAFSWFPKHPRRMFVFPEHNASVRLIMEPSGVEPDINRKGIIWQNRIDEVNKHREIHVNRLLPGPVNIIHHGSGWWARRRRCEWRDMKSVGICYENFKIDLPVTYQGEPIEEYVVLLHRGIGREPDEPRFITTRLNRADTPPDTLVVLYKPDKMAVAIRFMQHPTSPMDIPEHSPNQ